MLNLLLLTSALLTAAPTSAAPGRPLPADSIGRVVQGGKTYLKHKVAKGDSFYAIARRYKVPMDQLVAANPKAKGTLSIGQVVLVPRATAVLAAPAPAEKPAPSAADKPAPAAAAATAPRAAGARTHVVTSGQTLSAIARKYHVSVADIRRWNNLKNDNLRLKQRLVVSAAPTAVPVAAAPEPKPEVAPRDEVKQVAEAKKEDAAREERKEEAKENRTEETRAEAPRRAADTPADDTTGGTEVAESLRKITENGMAEAIESSGESAKFLALHRTAAVGSLLQVKNPQNGQSVYVRVIGKLPPTGANENVIIRLSRRAVQKLQVVDQRFRVEVSYMP